MGKRSHEIFYQLIKKRVISEVELLEEFNISSRQLQYSIENINEELKMNQLPLIEKNNGHYYSNLDTEDYFAMNWEIKDMYFPREDRVRLIILMIMSRNQPLSLDHFSIDLKISKNTALTYVKKSTIFLEENELTLKFTRKEGYHILGDEWDKRTILFQVITKLYKKYGEKITKQLLGGSQKYTRITKQNIVMIENYLNIKYVDEEFYPLVYFIAVVFQRIDKGKSIEGSRIRDKQEIENTAIYQSLLYLMVDLPNISTNEKLFLALQLLSTNVRNKNILKDKDLPLLENALWEFLIEFEANTFLVLKDKKELLQKLINHFRPAYYRIKYNISIENMLYEQIQSEYRVLHNFVCHSIKPLENFFQTPIADEEVAYITLFIGGHLLEKDSSNFEDKIIKAVILCPNGISMSNLIENNLIDLFPEFLFYPTSSIREYQDFKLPHNIVFSTVPVQSTRKVYVINDILNKTEQIRLRQYVIKDIFNMDFSGITSEDIMEVVKKYTMISDKSNLQNQLDMLLLKGKDQISKVKGNVVTEEPRLFELLNKEQIIISNENLEWVVALEKLSNILFNEKIIGREYQNILIKEYSNMPNYILIRNKITLPHLAPSLAEQKLGVSMLLTDKGISYGNQTVNLAILLTTPDKTSHLSTLYDINKLAHDENFINEIINMKSKERIILSIEEFFSKD
ncbi:PTS sugar transporter subunit IIA [Tetragenococcus halophilus subsp. flandriensis]|uniref:BglG family transcription antiterminator n=1 Tax=Tetragenococcus halophilus TaxID=51669 RepID=UPI0023E8FDD8|nr:BglG family transcription antiterminator [Tetragenococcus halophilus]GMA07793.1 PTS sugar transporter subunit IIA [Tetragenococcus halophilus subsp. flandriensis]